MVPSGTRRERSERAAETLRPEVGARARKAPEVGQRTPSVTESDVDRVVRRDFEPKDAAEVELLLRELGGGMSPRVKLAVLKLSGGLLDSVHHNLDAARRDWRDVIAHAEYPNYMRRVSAPGAVRSDQRSEIIRADREQYDAWLNR